MKAIQFHEHGGPEVLRHEDVDDPRPGAAEAVVKVTVCAVNRLDIWIRKGSPAYRIPMPHISGCDVAGEVVECGSAVSGLAVGTRVIISPGISCGECEWCRSGHDNICQTYKIFGAGTQGGYAGYSVARASDCIPIPDEIGDEEAAAFPLTFLTAWHMLFTRAGLRAGQTVLVTGAAGGVGSAAIQMARMAGAKVIAAVGSDEKAATVRSAGASHVVVYPKETIRERVADITGGRGVDIVLDHVGGDVLLESLSGLAKNGTAVICGVSAGPSISLELRPFFMRQQSLLGSMMGTRKELDEIIRLIASRKLRPVIDRTFPLSQAAAAQQWMEQRRNFGKILLIPGA